MKTQLLLEKIVQDWHTIRPHLDSGPLVTVVGLLRTAHLLSKAEETVFSAYGLNSPSFEVMITLYRSAAPEGLTLGQLAELTVVTPSSITNRVDRLVQRGLVERHLQESDRRSWFVRLTQEGRKLIDTMLPEHFINQKQTLSVLTDSERQQLDAILLKLMSSLEDH